MKTFYFLRSIFLHSLVCAERRSCSLFGIPQVSLQPLCGCPHQKKLGAGPSSLLLNVSVGYPQPPPKQLPLILYQWFSNRGNFPSRAHLAKSKDIFGCHNEIGGRGSCAIGIYLVNRSQSKDAAKCLQCTGQPPQHIITQPKMSIVLPLKNPVVDIMPQPLINFLKFFTGNMNVFDKLRTSK